MYVKIFKMGDENTQGVLKAEMILQKTRALSLVDVHSINIWGYNLSDVSIVSKCPNVNTISMPINSIKTLSAFQHCPNLKILLLRQNLISTFKELNYLKNLVYLENLTLSDNPITQLPNYRSTVLSMLPQLKKLDNIDALYTCDYNNENINRNANIRINNSVDFSKHSNLFEGYENNIDAKSPNNQINNNFSQKNLNMKILIQNQKKKELYQKQLQQNRYKSNYKCNNSFASTDDSHYLTAVLTLIPELSTDSLQIVLEAIHQQCHS